MKRWHYLEILSPYQTFQADQPFIHAVKGHAKVLLVVNFFSLFYLTFFLSLQRPHMVREHLSASTLQRCILNLEIVDERKQVLQF